MLTYDPKTFFRVAGYLNYTRTEFIRKKSDNSQNWDVAIGEQAPQNQVCSYSGPESKITRNASDPQSSFPGGSDGKASAYSVRDWGSISVLRISPQKGMATCSSILICGTP